jgi:hypothetical protein
MRVGWRMVCLWIRSRTADTVAGSLDVVFDHAGGVSSHQRSRGHIPGDYGRCGDDAAVADRDAWQDDGMCTNETIVADVDVAILVVDVIVRQDCGSERDHCILPDVESERIGLVELGTHRNNGSFSDIHFPNPN